MNAEEIKALIEAERARLSELASIIRNPASSTMEIDDAFEEADAISCNIRTELDTLYKRTVRVCGNPIRYVTADYNFIVVHRFAGYHIYKNNRRRHAAILRHCAIGDGRLIPVRAVCADNGGCVCG